jgi:hypothetical protein
MGPPAPLKKARLLNRWFPVENILTAIGDSFTFYPEYMMGMLPSRRASSQ